MNAAAELDELLANPGRHAYAYAYPHKSAYRPLEPAPRLDSVWASENRENLFLYVHVPFCEFRCGFCNLFTLAHQPDNGKERGESLIGRYLKSLKRQAEQLDVLLGERRFVRFAMGGGTPTILAPAELDDLLNTVRDVLGAQLDILPGSVEVSPDTATPEKLQVLRDHGIHRISIGVQSFFEKETTAVFRPQAPGVLESALGRIRNSFACLNIDLMYGLPGQTMKSWIASLESALRFDPDELFLYPMYVRPLTGFGKQAGVEQGPEAGAFYGERIQFYRAGRDFLLGRGYEQFSMRLFRKRNAQGDAFGDYQCQQDGMVGLGCGARSYTRDLHYSFSYAVSRRQTRAILEDYIESDDFSRATHGYRLNPEERRRRYVIQSLLNADGLSRENYEHEFGGSLTGDFPELDALLERGLAGPDSGNIWLLTEGGFENSDAIAPFLFSSRIRDRMEEYVLK